MDEMVKTRSTELNNVLVALSQAKTVEEITNLINKAVDKNDELQDLLEDEFVNSEDKEVIIQGLKGELEKERVNFREEKESLTNKYQEEISNLKAMLSEKEEVIKNMEVAENYALSDDVAELNLHEILGSLKSIEHIAVEINGKVECTEVAVRNMNLNSNSAQKTLNKLTANVGNLVELVKVYVKNVSHIDKRVEEGNTVAKDALNKAEEVELRVKDTSKEVTDLHENMDKLEGTVKKVEDKTDKCSEEVKEVRGLFQKLKGLFR